jgi:hypothetical protein
VDHTVPVNKRHGFAQLAEDTELLVEGDGDRLLVLVLLVLLLVLLVLVLLLLLVVVLLLLMPGDQLMQAALAQLHPQQHPPLRPHRLLVRRVLHHVIRSSPRALRELQGHSEMMRTCIG